MLYNVFKYTIFHGSLAQSMDPASCALDESGQGLLADDHLNEGGGGHGVEEVQPQEVLRAGQLLRQPGHGQRGRVGGKDRAGRDVVLNPAEGGDLQRPVLRDSLHHQCAVAEVCVIH